MHKEILALEEKLNSLLPVSRKPGHDSSKSWFPVATRWSEAVWEKASAPGELPIDEKQAQQARDLSMQAVFIFGAHRSGTTLLRDILDGHPSLSVIPSEGTFLTNQYKQLLTLPVDKRCAYMAKEWLRRLVNPINQAPYWLLGRSSPELYPYIDFARTFITWWNFFERHGNASNKFLPLIALQVAYAFFQKKNEPFTYTYWVDKTPGNEYYLPVLRQQFPKARIIHIIRNPANILASRKKIQVPFSVRDFVRTIQTSFKTAARQQSKKDMPYLVIRYEDLCINQAETLKTLASFLEIEFSPCLLQPTVAGKPTQANSSFKFDLEYGKILSTLEHSPEKIINARELQLLSVAVGDIAASLGYTLPRVSPVKKFVLKTVYRLW